MPAARLSRLWQRIPSWLPAVLDQAVIALTNLLLQVVFSRLAGLGSLGVYSLISVTLLSAMGLSRTLLTDPWLASRLRLARSFTGELRFWVFVASLAMVVPVAVVALWAGHSVHSWLLAVIIAPFFVLQDAGRYGAYKVGAVWRAVASDSILFVTVATATGVGLILGRVTIVWALCSWLLAYCASLVPLYGYLRGSFMVRGSTDWWRLVCRPLALPLLLDSVAYIISTNVTMYVLAGFASAAAVGAVRVVNALYPITMVFAGLTMWLVPSLTHRGLDGTDRLRSKAILGLGFLGAASILASTLIGPWAARVVFGVIVDRRSLLLGGIGVACNGVAAVWLAVIRVYGTYRPIAWCRLVTGVAIALSLLSVPAARGVHGYLLLVSGQSVAVAAVAWVLQAKCIRERGGVM